VLSDWQMFFIVRDVGTRDHRHPRSALLRAASTITYRRLSVCDSNGLRASNKGRPPPPSLPFDSEEGISTGVEEALSLFPEIAR